jgi:F0F1-type ATP synthase beta subunit
MEDGTVTDTKTANVGTIVQVIGPVVDVEFPTGELPDIYNAIEIPLGDCIKITERFFLCGEMMFVDAYQAEHEYEFTYPGVTYSVTAKGKENDGFTPLGIGPGSMF